MAYSDFTLKEVTNRFRLRTEAKPDVFSEVPEGEVSALLQSLLQVYVPLALAIHTEKARSEFMGIRVRRDNWASVRYAEGLNASKSSVTLQSPDRHGIVVRQVVLKRK